MSGELFYLATYEHNYPSRKFSDLKFSASSADDACDYILGQGVFSDLEKPVSAAAALETEDGFSVSCKDMTL